MTWVGLSGSARGDDFFRDQVAPILRSRCLVCHNAELPNGDLSLQDAHGVSMAESIVPGSAEKSTLIDLISPVSGKAEMPQEGPPLTSDQIAAIRRWIDDGASWPTDYQLSAPVIDDFDWWSYQPLRRQTVPDIRDAWVRTPIDAFVLKKLRAKGMMPAPPADRRTLIRRLTYDLTGLPPTPEQVADFVDDDDPIAYQKLVDRLLESHHYGERWARHWLDVVQYADTCGYDKDKLRPNAWPYRDYVIRSFNDDKPYGQFVQEQIAGDALFPDTPDGILGLGFIAAGPWDHIGHVEVPESKIDGKVARNLDRDDMVSNTLNTFCSLTVQCARCHNHKFDPITQEHYYALQSVFAAVDRAERPYDVDTASDRKRYRLDKRLIDTRRKLRELEKEIADAAGDRLRTLDNKIRSLQQDFVVDKDPAFGFHSEISDRADQQKSVTIKLRQAVSGATIVLRPCHDDYAGIGSGFGFPVRFRVEVADSDAVDRWHTVADYTQTDFDNPGLSAVHIVTAQQPIGQVRVTATRLAIRQNDFIFALAELQVIDGQNQNVARNAVVTSSDSIEAPVRWGRDNLVDGKWARPSDPTAADALWAAQQQRQRLLAAIETDERKARRSELQALV
ncbi:MAG: DUF1549 domain-containing protein, partial [Pirellulaceae bacterium]|nr:DUF1549 domain-containing protein [Pirellulaceae bacterium]